MPLTYEDLLYLLSKLPIMSNVNLHKAMRTNTLNKISASFKLGVLFLSAMLLGFGQSDICAQTYYNVIAGGSAQNLKGVICSDNTPLVEKYTIRCDKSPATVGGIKMDIANLPQLSSSIGFYPAKMELYAIAADGTETLVDVIDDDANNDGVGFSPKGYIGTNNQALIAYTMNSSRRVYGGTETGTMMTTATKIQNLTVNPSSAKVDVLPYYGATMMLRIYFMSSNAAMAELRNVVSFYFDPIGYPGLIPINDQSANTFLHYFLANPGVSLCPGEEVQIKNDIDVQSIWDSYDPTKASFLGQKYQLSPEWQRGADSWGRPVLNFRPDQFVYTDDFPSKQSTSGFYELTPLVTVDRNGTNFGCNLPFEGNYIVDYFTPLVNFHTFSNDDFGIYQDDETKNTFVACSGDNVTYMPRFVQNLYDLQTDVELFSDVFWSLYEVDNDGNVIATIFENEDINLTFDYIFAGVDKTRRYKVVSQYVYADDYVTSRGWLEIYGDANGIKIPNDCKTEEFFTIEVREVSANAVLSLNPSDYICDGQEVEVSAVVTIPSSSVPEDYAYRWYVNGTQFVHPNQLLGSGEWIEYGDAEWSDPTVGIKAIDPAADYPSDDNTPYGYRFWGLELANTYKFDGITFYCPMDFNVGHEINERPKYTISSVEKVVCANQPFSFSLELSNSIFIFESPIHGAKVEIYDDANFTNKLTEFYPMSDETTPSTYPNYNDHIGNTLVWWGCDGISSSKTVYAKLINNTTGCVGDPLPIHIHVRPTPELSNVVATPADYCMHADPSALSVSVELSSEYESFDWAGLGLATPDVTYHWSWRGPKGKIGAADIVNTNLLEGHFDDKAVTAWPGDVTFSVYATDNSGCGYQLDYDGTVLDGDMSSQVPVEGKLKVHELPKFSVDQTVYVCAATQTADIQIASLDNRDLTFTFTPSATNAVSIVSSNSPVDVAGNSNGVFTVNFNEADIAGITKFAFDVHVEDHTANTCGYDTVMTFNAHVNPLIIDVPAKVVCEGQPFFIDFEIDPATVTSSAKQVDVELFLDAACTIPASDFYPMSNVGGSLAKQSSAFHDDIVNTHFYYGNDKAVAPGYKLYARVSDSEFGCQSLVKEIIVNVRPLPSLSNMTFSPVDAYCHNADASALVVSVDLNDVYESFDWAAIGLAKPSVTYHWNWVAPNGSQLGAEDVVDDNTLSGVFDASLTALVGKDVFTVFATDDAGCGYVFNQDGTVATPNVTAITPAKGELRIDELPAFSILEGVEVCASEETATVSIETLDTRSLTLTFTPKAGTPACTFPATLTAAPGAPALFTVTFDEAVAVGKQKFEFDVNVKMIGGLECEADASLEFTAFELPLLNPVDPVVACSAQPVGFDVNFASNITAPNGLTYRIYEDAALSVVPDASKVVPAPSGKNIRYSVSADYLSSIAPGSTKTLYVVAEDNETGCVSHPVTVEIRVLPLPTLESVAFNPTAYCLNTDPTDLEATAVVSADYLNFDYAAWGLAQPVITYHWTWADASGAVIASDETTNNVISGVFTNAITAKPGTANIKVWATDNFGCGYALKADGTPVSTTSGVLPVVEDGLTINTLPDYTIQSGVLACADQGGVEISIASNDSRELTFDFTALDKATKLTPDPDAGKEHIVVPGNSSALFSTTLVPDDIKDVVTYEYKVVITDNTSLSCKDEAVLSFVAHPNPVVSVSTPDADRHVCQGQSVELAVLPTLLDGGVTPAASKFDYVWTIDGNVVASNKNKCTWNTSDSEVAGNHNVNVKVSYTFPDGHICQGEVDFTVFVNPLVEFDVVATDNVICEGELTTIVVTVNNVTAQNHLGVANDYDLSSFAPAAVSMTPGAPGSYTFLVEPTSTTTYSVAPINSVTGCVSRPESASAQVEVKKKGHIRLSAFTPAEVCAGPVSVTLAYSVVNPSEFSGIDFATLNIGGLTVVSHTDNTLELAGNLSTDLMLSSANCSGLTLDGCEVVVDNSSTLRVRPIPSAPVVTAPADNEVCERENVQMIYKVASTKGFRYEWYIQSTEPQVTDVPYKTTTSSTPNLTINPFTLNLNESTKVWVRAIDANYNKTMCPSDFASFDIIVHKLPIPVLKSADDVCHGEPATIILEAPVADATHNYNYVFYDSKNVALTPLDNTSMTYTTAPLTKHPATFYVQVIQTETGCAAQNMLRVDVNVHQRPVGSAKVAYADNLGSSVILLPDGSKVNRAAFCSGEEGTATVKISAKTAIPADNIVSTLVAVSAGNISDWVKVDEKTWTSTKVWDAPVELTFSIEDSHCSSDEFKANVDVIAELAKPDLNLLASADEVCFGADNEAITLTVPSYPDASADIRYRFEVRNVGDADWKQLNWTTSNVTNTTFGTLVNDLGLTYTNNFEYRVTAYNIKTGCCSENSDLALSVVNKLPTPTITTSVDANNRVICPEETVTLYAPDGYVSYLWPDESTGMATTQSVIVNPSVTTRYHLTVTDNKGCESDTVGVTIEVRPRPAFTLTANPSLVCYNSNEDVEIIPTAINGPGSADNLTFAEPYTFTSSTSAVVTPELQGDGSYRYFVRGNVWIDASYIFTATVQSAPENNSCLSEPVNVNVDVVPALKKPDVMSNSPQDGTDTRIVHVCEGSTLPVTVVLRNTAEYVTPGVEYSYHWYLDAACTNELTNGPEYSIDDVNGTITFVPTATFSLYAKVRRDTAPLCESEISDEVRIIIEPLPDAPAVNEPSDTYICLPEEVGKDIFLTVVSPASDNKYFWYRQNAGKDDTDMTDDYLVAIGDGVNPAKIAAPSDTSYYYARTQSIYGCLSAAKSEVKTIYVSANPEIIEVTKPKADICSGESVNMTVSVKGSTNGITYIYERRSSDASRPVVTGTLVDGVLTDVPAVSESETWYYEFWAQYGGSGGCLSLNSVVYEVNVHALPTVNDIQSAPYPVCEGEDITVDIHGIESNDNLFFVDGHRYVDLRIYGSNGFEEINTGMDITMGLDTTYVLSGITRANLPIFFEVIDAHCSQTYPVDIQINDIPNFDIVTAEGKADNADASTTADHLFDYCFNESMTLQLAATLPAVDNNGNPTSYTFQWQRDGFNIPGAVESYYTIPQLDTHDNSVFTLVVTNGGCSFTRSAQIVVHELPLPEIIQGNDKDTYCTDGSLYLSADRDYVTYVWDVLYDGEPTVDVDGTEKNLVYDLSSRDWTGKDNVEVNLRVVDEYGCENVASTYVAWLTDSPVISDVFGTETCGESPFYITVNQDKPNYYLELLDASGLTASDYTLEDGGHRIVTSNTFPEGDYTVVVHDEDSYCVTSRDIRLSRYDIQGILDLESNIVCENGVLNYKLNISDANGHADFMEKVGNSLDVYVTYYNSLGDIVYAEPRQTITSESMAVSLIPNDPDPTKNPRLVADKNNYRIGAVIKYRFISDVIGELACESDEAEANLRVFEKPALTVDHTMPICLGTDLVFTVDPAPVEASAPEYRFYVNGILANAANTSSNVFSTADYPELVLVEGDVVTAEVLMDNSGTICTSDPIVVTYFDEFFPKMLVDVTNPYCRGGDIAFTVQSTTPVDVPAGYVAPNIVSYELHGIAGANDSIYVSETLGSAAPDASGIITYWGTQEQVQVYAITTDEFGCVRYTDTIAVNIHQFFIEDLHVFNAAGERVEVYTPDGLLDLCADIEYTYKAVLVDGKGNVIPQGSDYDFTFSAAGNVWNPHTVGDYLVDSVLHTQPMGVNPLEVKIEATYMPLGCMTSDDVRSYMNFVENVNFHEKPTPNEQLLEALVPVSDDPADARTFETCFGTEFSFKVEGPEVTVVFDGTKHAIYRPEGCIAVLDESKLLARQMNGTFEYVAGVPTHTFKFSIDPSAAFHSLQFIVSDGSCEVESDVWNFRKYEEIKLSALGTDGSELISDDILTLCVGDVVEVVPSTAEPGYAKGYNFNYKGVDVTATDFSAMLYELTADEIGTFDLIVTPDFGRNGCSKTIKVVVNEAPMPEVKLLTASGDEIAPTSVDPTNLFWSFLQCENRPTSIAISGAIDYMITSVTRDGVDVSDQFVLNGNGATFSQNAVLNYDVNTAAGDASVYRFEFTAAVVNCFKTASFEIVVPNNPEAEFINGTPIPLVIAGAQVPVEVTPGYADYEFIVGGVSVQAGSSNLLEGANNILTESSDIEVIVKNTYGCDTTIVARVEVLEGIDIKNIVASSDFYCSEDTGVIISVVNPQIGVTYEIEGLEGKYAPITFADSSVVVAWSPVRVDDPATLNPQVYNVLAYYASLPDQKFGMANTVSVEEVTSPADVEMDNLLVTDCSVAQDPNFIWTLNGADPNNTYWLMLDGTIVSGEMTSTTGVLDFNIFEIMKNYAGAVSNGEYKVYARTKRQSGEFVCDRLLRGTLTVDRPTTATFDVTIDPANGSYCVDDMQGVTITVSGSDYSSLYAHEYVLFADGVEVARQTSSAARQPIVFKNITIANPSAIFSVVCQYNGCEQPMNNTVEVKAIEPPVQQTVTVSTEGRYCYDENGVTVTVGGQQDGVLYTLYRNGVATGFSHLGDASGAGFTFENVIDEGNYSVVASLPWLDRGTSTCLTTMTDVFSVLKITEPLAPIASLNKLGQIGWGAQELELCLGEEATVFIRTPEIDVLGNYQISYELYDQNGLVSATPNLTNMPAYISFDNVSYAAAGDYIFTLKVVKTYNLPSGATKTCEILFDNALKLTYLERPNSGETLTLDAFANPADPCYGTDIVIENPNLTNPKQVYILYLLDENGLITTAPVDSISPANGDPNRFTDIRNAKGTYAVYASNGVCVDLIGNVLVEQDKYAKVQLLEFADNMCQGDPGVPAGLIDSEKNVLYSLFYIEPGYNGSFSQSHLAENTPGTLLATFEATYDHQRVIFSGINYNDGRTPISDLVSRDGYYYVTALKTTVTPACPTASPVTNFKTLKLPNSYRLMRNKKYCDGLGATLFLEASENDPTSKITYMLYSKDADGNLTYVDEILSTGADSLAFKAVVTEGTYVAIAIKEYPNGHICTSSMEGEVTVEPAASIGAVANFGDVTLTVCNNNDADYQLPASSLIDGVSYYATSINVSPEYGFTAALTYTSASDGVLRGLPDGMNVIWASYDNFDCLVEIGRVDVKRNPELPANVINEVACGGSFVIEPAYLVKGAFYELRDESGHSVMGTLYEGIDPQLEFSNIAVGRYTVIASFNGDCETTLGTVDVKPVQNVLGITETVVACGSSLASYELSVVHPELLVDGATYYIVDSEVSPDVVRAFGINYKAGDEVVFANLKPGNYKVYSSFENYSCLTDVISVVVVAAEVNNYNLTARRECNDKVYFSLDSSDVNVSYELWVVKNDKSEAPVGLPVVIGDGNPINFQEFDFDSDASRYFVKAVTGECPAINLGHVYAFSLKPEFSLTASNFHKNDNDICSGNDLVLTLDKSDVDVNYYLTINDETTPFPGSERVGDGNEIVWDNIPAQEGVVVFRLHAYKDNCSSDDWPEVLVDFSATKVPTGELTVYIQGKAYKSTDTNIPAVCPGTNIVISALVQGANVKTYNFMRRTPDANDFAVGLSSPANSYIPYYSDETNINGEITVRLDVETFGGCMFTGLDSIKFTLQNDLAGEKHLVAREDIYDYCEGELGVKLGYVNYAERGSIYRLYKVSDANIYDELVDIQEIPAYDNYFSTADTLFFNGWGYGNIEDGDYAPAGTYYVLVENKQGCSLRSDSVVVVESPSPAAKMDSVYYVFVDADGLIDKSTANQEFGVLGGSVAYTLAQPGNTYYLMKNDTVVVTSATVDAPQDLVFGPIKEINIDTITGVEFITIDHDAYGNVSGINSGEGVYSILVKSGVEPYCESVVGNVTFVAEELVAYNVEIYLNANEMAVVRDLVPNYNFDTHTAYKGNHMYIDWSSKIDRIYRPVVEPGNDGFYVNDVTMTSSINPYDDPDYFDKGYTNIAGSYNSKIGKFTGKAGSSNVWFQIINDPANKISGTYGFINVNYAQGGDSAVISMNTPTGYFYYMKQPSFYGQEKIKYYIENKQMPGRVSNVATITVLCGNESTNDSVSVFLIPNAFSPNGDGLNDVFKIIIPEKYQDNSESKLQVFNRWGTLVYRSSGLRYGEDGNWWDGTSSTSNMVTLGSKLPSGTYYYVFTITFIDKQHATKSERKMHGYIELRR